ncbi:N-acetylglucosamine-6-phosphate deacetylase [Lederbergia wuyishanensis]|uniref:N-acetylglucosamine-6-phosphate deacetylase n=1 Tax=Lederbergia wuyishanensis TaxID=1347903 RepID=A0ABU0D8E6_9BACI|nr:N-acetylglucosamine-6-phosphate deacetylase [Lederbergia wuyishanensis]MCJ8009217.1 N-acetylglucosamine-6-phosphate deacetylase [Lederbergia wuyishanensis]MDQ0344653.1 N-acetylglucosamine-6-phosphate deacetylase [Lederbergia wuyishanensis]
MDKKVIVNARVVTPGDITQSSVVWIENAQIQKVDQGILPEVPSEYEIIDAKGQLLIPGMIDVHIHGANGFDMMDGTEESILEVSKTCAMTGCTSFLVTSVSSSIEDLMIMIRNVKKVIGTEQGAKIAGIHLEGPYLNVKRKGMQNELYLRHPNIDEMKEILIEAGDLVKMVTIAPELPGGIEMVEFLKEQGIIVAIAHSDATYEEAKEAFSKGASHVTHCFNGMRPIHHRDPGLVVAAFEEEHVSLQAIVDQIHLHPAIVRLMHRIKGPEGVVLITDALQAMQMGDGEYEFGGHKVTVANGEARLADGTLASSTVTMNEALQKTVESGISLDDAVYMGATTPANILGMLNKGRIASGMDADLVLLDSNFDVLWTMIEGDLIMS